MLLIETLTSAGKLTTTSMCTVIAHLQPDKAIIVDESLTSGGAYWDLSKVGMNCHVTEQNHACAGQGLVTSLSGIVATCDCMCFTSLQHTMCG